jgi:hypothetical protein
VVAGNLVLLAALLMQAYPAAPASREVILHLHADDGVHAGEGIDHNANQGAIAQSGERADVCRPDQLSQPNTDGGKDSGKKHADRLSALRGASISSKSLMLSVGFRKTSQAQSVRPPSTTTVWPVTIDVPTHRNTITSAMS